jgi:hypothetical protein
MARALSSLCLLVVFLAGGSAAFAGKEKIAILGLEVVGNTGTIDAESTRVAQDFTVALRTQPRAGRGMYQWTPGSEKELVDEKIMADCQSEEKTCMAKIGKNLGADVLVYGRVERKSLGGQAGYQITLKFLRVENATALQGWTDFVPIGDANGTKLQDWARKGYRKLTNDFDGGTLRVRIKNDGVDRGTILIDGEERGNITSGSGEVSSLPEGRYKISIVVAGFDRWDSTDKVTIRNGEVATEDITLKKGRVTPCDPLVSKDCGGTISDPGPKTGAWKGLMVAGVLIAGGGGVWGFVERGKFKDIQKNCGVVSETPGDECFFPGATTDARKDARDKEGDKHALRANIGLGIAITGGAIALVGFIKGFVVGGGKEKVATTKKRGSRDVLVTPVVDHRSAGATLRLRW